MPEKTFGLDCKATASTLIPVTFTFMTQPADTDSITFEYITSMLGFGLHFYFSVIRTYQISLPSVDITMLCLDSVSVSGEKKNTKLFCMRRHVYMYTTQG